MIQLREDLLTRLEEQDPFGPRGPGRDLHPNEELVLARLFVPHFSWTWYAVSASKDDQTGDVQFFGLVDGWELELGYFWLSELLAASCKIGAALECDQSWEPITLAKLMEELEHARVN